MNKFPMLYVKYCLSVSSNMSVARGGSSVARGGGYSSAQVCIGLQSQPLDIIRRGQGWGGLCTVKSHVWEGGPVL